MKKRWRQHGFTVVTALLLTVFTAYALLDVFVIPHEFARAQQGDAQEELRIVRKDTSQESDLLEENEKVPGENGVATEEATGRDAAGGGKRDQTRGAGKKQKDGEKQEPAGGEEDMQMRNSQSQTAENAYRDENLSICLTEYQVNDTTAYVAEVTLLDPSNLKTAMANDTYGKNVKADTSEIAAAHQAILAINGDFYGARNDGYVIREGVLYRDAGAGREDLVIYRDGSFGIVSEDEISAQELLRQDAWNVLSFGPALVVDGEIAVREGDEVGKAMASNPRTAIGITPEGHYLMVVSDGRTQESEGLSLLELAQFLKSLGAQTAYNLDGGGSSTMIFQGNLVNHPTTGGQRITERSVSDIVYIGY